MRTVICIAVILVCFTNNLWADGNSPIIEKRSQRYFKLGEMEYICNSDNRISDTSAKDILRRVQQIYDRPNNSEEEYNNINTVWDFLHLVYSGAGRTHERFWKNKQERKC